MGKYGYKQAHCEDKKSDNIWRAGIGILAGLFLLFFLALAFYPKGRMILFFLYGVLNLLIVLMLRYTVSKNIDNTLYKLSYLIENLKGGKEKLVFPVAEDTILSKLQVQILKLYDILCSYEEREQSLRNQISKNIGDLVHQINTPITNIDLYAELLQDDALTRKEQILFLNSIKQQAAKLSWLGEGFSKISRMETGIILLKPVKQKVLPMVLQAVNQVMPKAEKKEMDIVLTGEQEASAFMDAKWTAEAIFNVLDNAVKYGIKGSVIDINISVLTSYVCVSVKNSGLRIREEEYHKIFKRFFRGEETGAEEGVGLGLYITKKILSEENGYIKVETMRDGKTDFTLYLNKIGIEADLDETKSQC